ncbi:MAG: TonB-dependent receptor domain-containing protein [Mucilaginibacter sp.]
MKILLMSLLLWVSSRPAYGQISGKLTDAEGQPVPYVTVSLLKAADSMLIRSALSSEKGDYKLDNVAPGQYILRLSSVGYLVLYTPVFELTAGRLSRDFGTQVLLENRKQLVETMIRANRPLLQQRADGTLVNVENSMMTKGSSALEVLERSPGVTIDHQNSDIALNGKSGAMVMLDGKPVRMATDQLVTMLGEMSANDISKIELLTSPSAAYDAEGSAGLINIVTRKNNRMGTNGTISLTAGYGYGEKATGGLSLNHHSGKTNIYGSYTYSHDKAYSDFHATGSEQEPLLGGLATSDFLSIAKPVVNNHQAVLGMDSKLNKSLTTGGSLNYNNSGTAIQTLNHGRYLIRPDSVYQLDAVIGGLNHWRNVTAGLYAEQQLRPGEKILLNLDYINYKNDYPTTVQSAFLDQNGNQAGHNDTLFSPRLKGISNTLIHVWAPKADYTRQFNSGMALDAGLKVTRTTTASTSAIQSLVDGEYVTRPSAMNDIVMKEGIGAAYTSLKVKMDSATQLVAGLRYEYSDTQMDNPLDGMNIADRRFGVLFPSLLLSKKISNHAEWLLSYSKRISRPSYADLASYVTYNGPSSINTGNPLLKPTITNNLKLGYNYKGYSFSALLSRDDDPIARYQIVYSDDKTQMVVSPQNMVYQDNLTFQANLPFSIGNWWEMNYDLIGGWHRFKLDYTPLPAEKTYFAYDLHAIQTFKLPRKFSIELSGYCNSTSYNGSRKVDGYGVFNTGIKKELKNKKGSFQLAISDPLGTNVISRYFGSLTQEAFDLKTHVYFHTESSKYLLFKLSYTRSFGTARSTGRRDKGSPEESERIER